MEKDRVSSRFRWVRFGGAATGYLGLYFLGVFEMGMLRYDTLLHAFSDFRAITVERRKARA